VGGGPGGDLERARDAVRREDWEEAYRAFQRVGLAALGPEDLEAAADAAWWTANIRESVAARHRAYAGYAAAGNHRRAAYNAWSVSIDHRNLGEASVASGWREKARRHLATEPECVEHGYLAVDDAGDANDAGRFDEARALAEHVIAIGRRTGSRDLEALGIETLGRISIREGRHEQGLRLLDEAMTSVLAGQVSSFVVGWILCDVLTACMEAVDLARAAEWTAAAVAWCERYPNTSPFHASCRIHRVEVTTLAGNWSEAEAQAMLASEVMMRIAPFLAAEAIYAGGEICRLRGDLAAAEEAFRRASELGRDPQPGLALVRLAQGRAEAAASALRVALASRPAGPLSRAMLLAAAVEAATAAGDLDWAADAAAELDAAAGNPVLGAIADLAGAHLALHGGRVEEAGRRARRAADAAQRLRLPYEAARAWVLAGLACRRSGDEETARLEFEAARAAFERLGAARDARAAEELLRPPGELPAGLSRRELEVLRLVASGKTNRQIAAELIVSEHTVSRHLQNIFRKLGVATRAAATAFAFEHDLV
jgi:DNA-binding CsgD family transcriptional regulator